MVHVIDKVNGRDKVDEMGTHHSYMRSTIVLRDKVHKQSVLYHYGMLF